MTTSVLILHVPGTNRDGDMTEACAMAGGRVTTKVLSDIVKNPPQILSYDFLVFPGGFSFGDDLGAGRVWADVLAGELAEPLTQFIESGRPVFGGMQWFSGIVEGGSHSTEGFSNQTHAKPRLRKTKDLALYVGGSIWCPKGRAHAFSPGI